LLGLIEVIPSHFWQRRESPDDWTGHQHVAHVATADGLLRETVEGGVWTAYEERKAELLEGAEAAAIRELLARMDRERADLTRYFEALPVASLDRAIGISGASDAWGRPVSWPLRSLLDAWSGHDTGHELAIRRAVTTPPDAAALSAAALRRRR
jgi:hypothetical protein